MINFLELLSLALAPGTAIMLYIYLKDTHEREPLYLLLGSFIFGIISGIITLALSHPLNWLIELRVNDLAYEFVDAFFKVAFVEEFSKFLFVRFVLFPNKNFNEPFDGIVYAVMVSMGFATLENVIYVFHYGFETGILRMFTAVPAHGCFGVLMGFFLGRAKFVQHRIRYFSAIALVVPTVFHGAYDYFFFIAKISGVWAGIWIGGLVSLAVGLLLSRRAIRLHQQASPFIEPQTQSERAVNDPSETDKIT